MTISTGPNQFGPLQQGFTFEFKKGYSVIIGPNDIGKTAILQLIFKKLVNEVREVGPHRLCMILPERMFIEISLQPGSRDLTAYNSDLANQMQQNILSYQNWNAPNKSELLRLLLSHSNLLSQIRKLNEFLVRIKLPKLEVEQRQNMRFENIHIPYHGSGLRSILPILAALTSDKLDVILIDEPEISLEPKLQKILRDILIECSEKKSILVSTHSHLFINRKKYSSNYFVTRNNNNEVITTAIASKNDLFNVVFDMLGSSVEDLFFPGNFLIVEGASDQVIVDKAIELLGLDITKIKVVSASGLDKVSNTHTAICNILIPLVMENSPYANRVVALIDKPKDNNSKQYREIKKTLKNRLFELKDHTLEEYLPKDLYLKAGRNKQEDINKMSDLEKDYFKLIELKAEISNSIADVLQLEDLDKIPIVKSSIKKARTT